MKPLSLERQIQWWTVLLIVVPSLLIMAIYTAVQVKTAKQQSMNQISQRVDLQYRMINSWLSERVENVIELAASDNFRDQNESQLTHDLYWKLYHDGSFNSMSYVDKDGLIRYTTLNTVIKFPSAVGQPYFEAAKAGRNYISDEVVGRNSGRAIINMSSPVYDRDGKFIGVVVGSVRMASLETLFRENWTGESDETLLINRQGRMLIRPRYIDLDSLPGRNYYSGDGGVWGVNMTDDALRKIRQGGPGTAFWTDYRGNDVMGAYLFMPERGWAIIGKIDEIEVLRPIYQQLAAMAGVTFLLLFLMLPLATRLTDRVEQPVDWLIKQAKLVASENYAQVGREERPEQVAYELGNLCDIFVAMSRTIDKNVSQLKEKETVLECAVLEEDYINRILRKEVVEQRAIEETLTQLNDALEHKVRERTADLSEEIRQQKMAEERFYKAFHTNPSMMYIVVMPDWKYVDVNESFAGRIGLSREEIIGLSATEIGLWVDNDRKERLQKQLLAEGQLRNIEVNYQTRSGERRVGFFSSDIFTLGNQTCALCVITDITEQKKFDAEIARLDKLNLVGQMAASIGHEIRNPLTTVRGYLQLFQRREKFSEYADQLHTMIEELDRANAIISEFLSLAKNKAVEMERGNLNEIVNTLFPLLQADAFRTGHDIKIEPGSIPDCKIDKKEIRQLLLNLVRNALDASPQGGMVNIFTYHGIGEVVLAVQDLGPGIPKDVLAKLGTPFLSTKEGGTGLGLAVCYRVAQRHGAKLEVSTSSQGTTFLVRFPSWDDGSS